MTPGARIAASIDIIGAIEAGARPADDTAAEYFRRRRFIGAKDRAAIAAQVYAVLRHRAALDWWIERSGEAAADRARARVIAALLLVEQSGAEAVAASFDGGRFRPAALAPPERRLVQRLAGRTLYHPAMRRAVAAEGIAAEPTRWSPLGLRLVRRVPLSGTAAFRDGLVEVQDEASQLAALLAGARPGLRVVDFCAGAGGKTLALAAAMGNRGK